MIEGYAKTCCQHKCSDRYPAPEKGATAATTDDVIVERFAQRQFTQHEADGLPIFGKVFASVFSSLVQRQGQTALFLGSALGS